MTKHDLQVETIVSAPYEENSYVVWRPERRDCIIIDPGFEPEQIVEAVQAAERTPAAILITHGHSDHIAGNRHLKREWPDCPLIIGVNEAIKLTDPVENLSAAFGLVITSPPADKTVVDGEDFEVAGMRFRVREIPGHSSGHVVFIYEGDKSPQGDAVPVVFGGDVLFAGSIGRTDFPGGSFEQLAEGIHEKLFTLPDETIVYSGHGPTTTIGREKRGNSYVGRPAGYRG